MDTKPRHPIRPPCSIQHWLLRAILALTLALAPLLAPSGAWGVDLDPGPRAPDCSNMSFTVTPPAFDGGWWRIGIEDGTKDELGHLQFQVLEEGTAKIGWLKVYDPNDMGRGLGSQLCNHADQLFQKEGIHTVKTIWMEHNYDSYCKALRGSFYDKETGTYTAPDTTKGLNPQDAAIKTASGKIWTGLGYNITIDPETENSNSVCVTYERRNEPAACQQKWNPSQFVDNLTNNIRDYGKTCLQRSVKFGRSFYQTVCNSRVPQGVVIDRVTGVEGASDYYYSVKDFKNMCGSWENAARNVKNSCSSAYRSVRDSIPAAVAATTAACGAGRAWVASKGAAALGYCKGAAGSLMRAGGTLCSAPVLVAEGLFFGPGCSSAGKGADVIPPQFVGADSRSGTDW